MKTYDEVREEMEEIIEEYIDGADYPRRMQTIDAMMGIVLYRYETCPDEGCPYDAPDYQGTYAPETDPCGKCKLKYMADTTVGDVVRQECGPDRKMPNTRNTADEVKG